MTSARLAGLSNAGVPPSVAAPLRLVVGVQIAALLCALSIGVLAPGRAESQGVRPARIATAPDSLIVSFLSVGPGEELFDRFGHAAIRVRDAATGLDSAWNWGMYDFNTPGFLRRFLTGDTRYWMAGFPTAWVLNAYYRADRAVWEQDLALDRAQADSLLQFLRWNARPENKFYRYDYYLDNCATRVRDAIDGIVGGELRRAMARPGAGITWRGETLRLASAFPAIAFGMTFALGPRADATLDVWQEAFIPMRLRDALRTVRIGADARPLVGAERVLHPVGAYAEAGGPPSYAGFAALLGCALAIVVAGLGFFGRSSGASRVAVGTVGTVWHLVLGLAGTLVLVAGLFTRHQFMGANASVLLGTPASLALALVYARAWSARAGSGVRRTAVALSAIAAAGACAAVAAHLVPSLSPSDWAPVLLVAPVQVALTWGLVMRERTRRLAA